jgi:hypothetical protein
MLQNSPTNQPLSLLATLRASLRASLLALVVHAGVPHSLFGFDAHQLVGQPLSQCVDIFSEWKQGHGEELSLLELLVTQVMATSSQTSKSGSGCSAWRVGVHRPVADDHHDVTVSGLTKHHTPSAA